MDLYPSSALATNTLNMCVILFHNQNFKISNFKLNYCIVLCMVFWKHVVQITLQGYDNSLHSMCQNWV